MFDRELANYFRGSSSPVIKPKLEAYVKALKAKATVIGNRSITRAGYETSGMFLMERLIGDANIKAIIDIKDPFDRYMKGVLPILGDLERVFDPAITHTGNLAKFISSPSHICDEYLFPTRSEYVFNTLPIGSGWDQWKHIRPFRIFDHDSGELSFMTYADTLTFKKGNTPTYAVEGLDVAALLLQYAAYVDENKGPPLFITDYLHRYVIQPALMQDGINIWLRKIYTKALTDGHAPLMDGKSYQWISATFGRIGPAFNYAMEDVTDMIHGVMNHNLTPVRLLASLHMLDNLPLSDHYRADQACSSLPTERQYIWCRFMKERSYLEMALQAAHLNPSDSMYSTFCQNLKTDLSILVSTNPWNAIPNSRTKEKIKTKFDHMKDMITDFTK